jgi:hypothetical protein
VAYFSGHSDAPWEPPVADSEIDHLLRALDRQRWPFRWKADGLDAAGLEPRVGSSALTLGGLLKHLAAVEELASSWQLAGDEPVWPTDPARWRTQAGWDETPDAHGATPAELCAPTTALWNGPARFAAALDHGGLGAVAGPAGRLGPVLMTRRVRCHPPAGGLSASVGPPMEVRHALRLQLPASSPGMSPRHAEGCTVSS